MATITTCYRTIVSRITSDVHAVYVVHAGFYLPDALDAQPGAVAVVERALGGPVSGTIAVHTQEQCVLFHDEPNEDHILSAADEDDWHNIGADEWDYAARILRHPVAIDHQRAK